MEIEISGILRRPMARRMRPDLLLSGIVAVILAAGLTTTAAGDAPKAALGADEIVKRSDDIMDPGESSADLEMTVRRPGEGERSYRMKLLSARDKMLVFFEYPPRDKGQAYLRVGVDTWLYLPSVNKTMRVPTRQSFAGGDFSNHDVLEVRLQQDYRGQLEGEEVVEGQHCYRLLLTARDRTAPYASIRAWYRKDNLWPVKREFHTMAQKVFKTLLFTCKQSGERPDTFVMSNILEKSKLTEMTWRNQRSAKHDPRIFTEAYLVRRR
jgi:outer membrane lipoprotein-sorting protein